MVNIKVIHHSLLSILKTFNIYQMIALYFLKLSRKTRRQNVLALNWLNCNIFTNSLQQQTSWRHLHGRQIFQPRQRRQFRQRVVLHRQICGRLQYRSRSPGCAGRGHLLQYWCSVGVRTFILQRQVQLAECVVKHWFLAWEYVYPQGVRGFAQSRILYIYST